MSLRSLHNMPFSNPNDINRGVSNRAQRMPQRPIALVRAVSFGSREPADILDVTGMPVRMPNIPMLERDGHWANLSQVLRQARASRDVYSNLSKRHYGAMVVLDNGIKALGTNVEASRQTVFCDLRYAITHGINDSIKACADSGLQLPTPTVKTVYLVNATLDSDPPVPCSDCQDWLNSRFCVPDTRVISLEKDPTGEGAVVHSRTVAEMLPLHKGRPATIRLITETPVADLPLDITGAAQVVLQRAQNPVSMDQCKTLLTKAQAAYQRNQAGAGDSGLKTGVGMLFSPFGYMASGGRFDWSTRWHESADLATAVKAFETIDGWQRALSYVAGFRCLPGFIKARLQPWLAPPRIQAVAYYGDDANLPPLASLGRIARHRGSSDTVIVTVENDRLQIRTIADFMPEMYRTQTGRSALSH